MKKIVLLFSSLCLSVSALGQVGCTEAPNGEYPEYVYKPVCNGDREFITEYGFSGEYSSVDLTKGVTYEFQGSLDTDFFNDYRFKWIRSEKCRSRYCYLYSYRK
ncbi:hypothetical protein IF128_04375 [Empedobacter stercoris]|uniref:hypothetical protein n=1 Tax=Empedobacter stercoris TaxID=1628248 RepID=UPI001662728D|nr:hypothetical protein [Empedobacter stercoris]MCA4808993.1 hypothetical protein [Empedobacter stercoris]QNT14128.1 hypothetical protein HNV03_05345 [Empedobacter stercoris]